MHPKNDRGLAIGLVLFVAIIVIGAFLYTLLNPAMEMIDNTATNQASTQAAQDEIDLATRIWDLYLYAVMLIGGLFIIARAVFESKRPG